MSSTLEEQTRVALALLREKGGNPRDWTPFNPSLRAAIARGERAQVGAIPSVAPSASATGPLADAAGPLSTPKADAAPRADGAPEPTDGRGVSADLMKVLKRAQQISKVAFHVHEGLRTLERQREMVRRGWSKNIAPEPPCLAPATKSPFGSPNAAPEKATPGVKHGFVHRALPVSQCNIMRARRGCAVILHFAERGRVTATAVSHAAKF